MHLVPGRDAAARRSRPFQRAARLSSRRSRWPGVKVVGDYVDNYTLGLPSEMGLLTLFDPATGTPRRVIDAAGLTDMRTGAVTALGATLSRAQGQPRARAHRRARHRVLERAAARPALRLRRDPRPFAPARIARRVRRAAVARSRQAGARDRRLGKLRARRRHRRRSVAAARAGADAAHRVDQAGAHSSSPTAR